nr:YkgJ family cysteine cluster protein [uncultured Halomonas sp.]
MLEFRSEGCRAGCGACCIAPSISSAIPGMPQGKPAGIRCVQLDEQNLCRLFGDPSRPAVCERFKFDIDVCGEHREQALATLTWLERDTR